MEILLNKYKSKNSSNVDNNLHIELESDIKHLSADGMSKTIDAYEQYVKEKEESNKYRFIFTISPICSNVLFNTITECVHNEGADDCIFIGKNNTDCSSIEGVSAYTLYKDSTDSGKTLTRKKLIKDTAYSHPEIGNIVYHCGYDIFNNHWLRNDDFSFINKLAVTGNTSVFNTIEDYLRTSDGYVQSSVTRPLTSSIASSASTALHLYKREDFYEFNTAIRKRLVESNGWFGFNNNSSIDSKNYNDISINKCMNNNKSCEQIDMYPDRSLYSMVPKYNKFRHRVENNWDFSLMYPYENYYNEIVETEYDEEDRLFSLRDATSSTMVLSGSTSGYKAGDSLYIKFITKDNEVKYINHFVTILNLGELSTEKLIYINTDTEMTVSISNLIYDLTEDETFLDDSGKLTFERIRSVKVIHNKNVNGLYCQVVDVSDYNDTITFKTNVRNNLAIDDQISLTLYYKDIYIEVPTVSVISLGYDNNNYDYYFVIKYSDIEEYIEDYLDDVTISGETYTDINAYGEIRVAKIISGHRCKYYFRKFKKFGDFDSTLNKLAFSKNAYGDGNAQLIINDDVFVNDETDNLGRPISELYLAIKKTNNGYEKWYSGNYTDEDIEYSHCFGKITDGLDMLDDVDDYNVHKIHNIDVENASLTELDKKFIPKTVKTLTDSIDFDDFIGDLVEYDNYNLVETVIENVYHRFNTAQREIISDEYSGLTIDELTRDDYDYPGFLVSNVEFNSVKADEKTTYYYHVNLAPEGYYYKPLYRIAIKQFNNAATYGYREQIDEISEYSYDPISPSETKITITILENNNLEDYSFIYLFNKDSYNKIEATVVSVTVNEDLTYTVELSVDTNLTDPENYYYFLPNGDETIYDCELEDEAGSYVSKDFKTESDFETTDELYDSMFTNGAHYFYKNILFFLRRQDPLGNYGLNFIESYTAPSRVVMLAVDGKYKEITKYEQAAEKEADIC